MHGSERQKHPERREITRRDVLKAGAALTLASLTGDTMLGMAGLDSALESRDTKIDVPQRPNFLKAFEEALSSGLFPEERQEQGKIKEKTEKTKESLETLGKVMDIFVDEMLKNTDVFTSRESGAVFPFIKHDTAEFAKRVYREIKKTDPVITERTPQTMKRKEFIFPPVMTTADGTNLGLWEEQFRQLLMKLPEALNALEHHREPEHHEIYSIGGPTSRIGVVTQPFAERVREGGAINAFADLDAEFVSSRLGTSEEQAQTEISFFGISLGSSLAVQTAAKLLDKGIATQIPRAEAQRALKGEKVLLESRSKMEQALRLPHLAVRADLAPGINEFVSRFDKVRGFATTTMKDLLSDYMRPFMQQSSKLAQKVSADLARRTSGRISVHMDKQQEQMKQNIIWPGKIDIARGLSGNLTEKQMRATLIGDAFLGASLPKGMKVTQVFGAEDPYMRSRAKEFQTHLKEGKRIPPKERDLRWNVLKSGNQDDRVFLARMRHLHPWLRESELRKMSRAISALEELKNKSS